MILDQSERRQFILDFIEKNDSCTKTDVIKYMDGTAENRSPLHAAMMTTIRIINDLTSQKKIIVKKDSKNSQIHHLHLNNDDEYNKLLHKINSLSSQGLIMRQLIKSDILPGVVDPEYYYLMLLHYYQRIGMVTSEIQKMESVEHNRVLVTRFIELMSNANKSSKLLEPSLKSKLKEQIESGKRLIAWTEQPKEEIVLPEGVAPNQLFKLKLTLKVMINLYEGMMKSP